MSAVLCSDSICVNVHCSGCGCTPRMVFNNSLVHYKKTVVFNIPR